MSCSRQLLQASGLASHVNVGSVKWDDIAVLVGHRGYVGVDVVLDVRLALDEGYMVLVYMTRIEQAGSHD